MFRLTKLLAKNVNFTVITNHREFKHVENTTFFLTIPKNDI
nr:MAG TPA: hypothetical protein [Caudoviricetes sp.]